MTEWEIQTELSRYPVAKFELKMDGSWMEGRTDGWMYSIVSRFREDETRPRRPSVRLANMSLSHRKMESLIGHRGTLALTQDTVAG